MQQLWATSKFNKRVVNQDPFNIDPHPLSRLTHQYPSYLVKSNHPDGPKNVPKFLQKAEEAERKEFNDGDQTMNELSAPINHELSSESRILNSDP
jgi:hypothetical protein